MTDPRAVWASRYVALSNLRPRARSRWRVWRSGDTVRSARPSRCARGPATLVDAWFEWYGIVRRDAA